MMGVGFCEKLGLVGFAFESAASFQLSATSYRKRTYSDFENPQIGFGF
ncbi:MAG: hypothetical protein L0Y36_02650 [Planctomycetales bacterium]|nr:hypothetical protein [Planctomycetales bacterium]